VVGYELLNHKTKSKTTLFTRHGLQNESGTVQATTIRLEFIQFTVDTTVNAIPPQSPLPAVNITLHKGDIKFTVKLFGWPFLSPQNTLQMDVTLAVGVAGEKVTRHTSKVPHGSMHTFTSPSAQANVTLLDFSVNDLNFTEPVVPSIVAGPKSNEFTLVFPFASFNTSLYYDPTLGSLLNGEGDGVGGDGNNNAIYIGVFVSIPIAVILVVLAVFAILAYFIYVKRTGVYSLKRLGSTESGLSISDVPD